MTTTTRLAAACRRPFSNGTEGHAWMGAWCDHCANDHGIHDDSGGGCTIVVEAMCDFPHGWPEVWLPEPDDGNFYLPSRLTCAAFQPCEPCGGDPGATDRAARMVEVTAWWAEHGSKPKEATA